MCMINNTVLRLIAVSIVLLGFLLLVDTSATGSFTKQIVPVEVFEEETSAVEISGGGGSGAPEQIGGSGGGGPG